MHWRENHHNIDGEEGMAYADTIFENLNKYITIIDIFSNVVESALNQIKFPDEIAEI